MRSGMTAVALLVAIGVAGTAPAPAAAGRQKPQFEALQVKRGAIPRGALKTRKPGPAARAKSFFLRPLRGLKPVNRKQHAYAPLKSGDVRVFDIVTDDGGKTITSLMTQKVSDVRIQGGRLRAQVAQTWEREGHSSTSLHVQDVSQDGVLMTTAETLDQAPATTVRVEGVALPRKLSAGQTWRNSTSYSVDGATVESHAEGRVIGKVRRAGPDRKMRDGFELEMVTHDTTTIDGTPHRSTRVHRAVYLKGIGEVESTSRTQGEAGSVTRRLVGFTPGGDPG